MKFKQLAIAALAAAAALVREGASADAPIILDEAGVRSLGIQTVEADYMDFAETLFAIGRIEPIPSRKAALSSRVAGHILELNAFEGDRVTKGQVLARVESLQPGNPPPRLPLLSPIDGMVMQSHTHIGASVSPDSELFEIVDLGQVYAVARLPEDEAGQLHPGSKARIAVAAVPEQSFAGELIRFGSEANAQSGTLDALFLIDNPDYRVRPGMRAEFSVILDTRSGALAVPREAVQNDGVNRFVFVKDFDLPNAFIKAPVQIGAQNDERVEIASGLFPGDLVVTRGAYALRFAGGGSISLKDALDAAHGHEHAADGSELTPGQRASDDPSADDEHDHGHARQGPLVAFLSILSALLLLLLVLSLAKGKRARA